MEPDYEKIMEQYKTFESLCDKEPTLVQWSYYLEHVNGNGSKEEIDDTIH